MQLMAALFLVVIGTGRAGAAGDLVHRPTSDPPIPFAATIRCWGGFVTTLNTSASFFRQYFFSQDREEMPFNRAQRSWVYRAAKNVDQTAAFGSTRDLRPEGTVIFLNCAFSAARRGIGAAGRCDIRALLQ